MYNKLDSIFFEIAYGGGKSIYTYVFKKLPIEFWNGGLIIYLGDPIHETYRFMCSTVLWDRAPLEKMSKNVEYII